ncbi:hypothetical protein mvi_63930 (plasmid) [Methylobacterium indicum]|uniref:Uncharacterized protein n=1 Tax=Methylobacterium indicum TaxID=1775910 RepID=A0A8H9C986_9HYPH|nr:hypothetical protein mvi_63930 [Methylobacterium indicum]
MVLHAAAGSMIARSTRPSRAQSLFDLRGQRRETLFTPTRDLILRAYLIGSHRFDTYPGIAPDWILLANPSVWVAR